MYYLNNYDDTGPIVAEFKNWASERYPKEMYPIALSQKLDKSRFYKVEIRLKSRPYSKNQMN